MRKAIFILRCVYRRMTLFLKSLPLQVTERHDALVRLRTENREIEEKLREALSSNLHQAELVKELKEELKQAKGKVSGE